MIIYAAYGSNMHLKQITRRCPEARVIGNGILNDYRLIFRGGGHANIEPFKGYQVPIVLWEITAECVKALDRYEGYPRYYIKKEVIVSTETEDVRAMVYIMTKENETIIQKPTDSYYETIYQGYLDNNISVRTLRQALKENIDEIDELEVEEKNNHGFRKKYW